jgi:hypothetical protein
LSDPDYRKLRFTEPALLISREEYAERLDAVRVEMRRRGIEVLLIDPEACQPAM